MIEIPAAPLPDHAQPLSARSRVPSREDVDVDISEVDTNVDAEEDDDAIEDEEIEDEEIEDEEDEHGEDDLDEEDDGLES